MLRRMLSQLTRFQRDRRGTSAIDYCLMAVLVAIFIMATVNFLSSQIDNLNNEVTSAIQDS